MIWAEIKKALNSTLGTSGFKPLDELISAGKITVASDNPFMDLAESVNLSTSSSTIYNAPIKLIAKNNGSLRLSISLTTSNRYYKYARIIINGEVLEEVNNNSNGDIVFVRNFSFSAGDEIGIQVENDTTSSESWTINHIRFLGTVVDTSMFQVEEA